MNRINQIFSLFDAAWLCRTPEYKYFVNSYFNTLASQRGSGSDKLFIAEDSFILCIIAVRCIIQSKNLHKALHRHQIIKGEINMLPLGLIIV